MPITSIPSRKIDAKVVFLTHYIPLYQVRVLQSIAASISNFQVLLSTRIEPNRAFTPDWADLNVTVQDTWTLCRQWRHRAGGFDDPLYVHFPHDTIRRLRALNPDVVMSLELGVRSLGAAIYCRCRPRTKLVLCTYMSRRTEQGRGFLRHHLRKALLHRADAVTYNGASCKDYLQDFGIASERLFPLPYAADDRSIYRGPVQRDDNTTRHRLLVVGQLTQRKGALPLLTQVADHCRSRPHRKVELIFAGDGPLRSMLQAQPLPENLTIQWLGNLTPADLSKWMVRCGALIAPTLADEWLLVVNEGLQAGLPILGSIHAQAVTTLVRDDVNGWRYDPMKPDSLGSALEAYFGKSAEAIATMRQNARDSVAERTPQWAARGAIDAVRHALKSRPQSSASPNRPMPASSQNNAPESTR